MKCRSLQMGNLSFGDSPSRNPFEVASDAMRMKPASTAAARAKRTAVCALSRLALSPCGRRPCRPAHLPARSRRRAGIAPQASGSARHLTERDNFAVYLSACRHVGHLGVADRDARHARPAAGSAIGRAAESRCAPSSRGCALYALRSRPNGAGVLASAHP